ncbi:hypothetical protein IWX90DRAFT_290018 [Phyllosticta citrichinensis]|uniref:Uncharacterized protein n=1 Tax=Phyllosticta citrichinensis TaxID=1130410 RepID=A0ABR1XPT2_9PEZI
MELPYLHNQRQYILSSLSRTQIIMDGLQTKISDAERSLTTNSKRTLEGDSSSSSNNETTPGLPRAQKKKLQQTRWRARTSLRNCESEQQVLFESLRQVQDRILRMQADILDKDAGPWIPPSASTNTWMPPSRPAAAGDHHHPNPDPTAVMTAYAANFYASPYVANSPYAHYPHGIPPSAYLDPDTTPDDLWTWQANDTHGPYTALPPSLLSNDPYQYTYAFQQQQQQQQHQTNNFVYDYEWADWDARGRKLSRAARSSYSAAGGPGPIEVVDEMGTHHYIYGDKGKDKEAGAADAASSGSPSTDETGRVAPGVFPEKWELGRPSLTVSIADGEGITGPKDGGSGSGKAMAAVVVKTPRGHRREQSAALSPRTSVFVPGKMSHESSSGAATAIMPTKSALTTTSGGSGSSNAADSSHHHHHPQQAHVHFAEPPPRLQHVPDPRATPFKAPSSPYPFARGDSKAAATKSQPYTPPHRRNSSLNSSASSASSFVSESGRGARKGSGSNNGAGGGGGGGGGAAAGKRRYSAAAVDLILNRLRENEGKPRKRRGPGQGHAHSKSADLDGAENRRGSGSSEADEGGENRKRGRQGVGWGSVDEPKYKVGGGSDGDVDMEGVD